HILVYAFDVLMQIYTSAGWDQREAAQSILKNNLYGLDIDDRAAQLAYFAVMMKARQYDRRLLTRGIQPNIYSIRESNGIQTRTVEYFHRNDPKLKADIESIVTEMRDAKEYGSILNITPVDFAGLYARFDEIRNDISLLKKAALEELLPLVKCAEMLAQKYDVVVTNPPYMAVSNAGAKVNDYVKKNFPDSKADMFAVFIERCGQMIKKNGYQAMITQHSWMFLSSFEKLRAKLLAVDIVNMAHLGARAFEEIGGEVVQTTSFVIRKSHIADYKGEYCRLIEPTSQQGKEDMFLAGENRYAADQSNFSKIPGSPVAYWVSKEICAVYQKCLPLGRYVHGFQGMITGNNEYYLRFWHEISLTEIEFDCKKELLSDTSFKTWVPYKKGGGLCRWYGNSFYVLRWECSGSGLTRSRSENKAYYLSEGVTWTYITTTTFSANYYPKGYLWDVHGSSIFTPDTKKLLYFLGAMNSRAGNYFLCISNPTLSFQVENILAIPISLNDLLFDSVAETVTQCIKYARDDWDSYETSWDFKRNPLV
ncbi:MAG: BREX-1 system adenine-specific DNA-methyltransferase PglX, partial [Oscillospiraceae bacterium]|nr:BREX-1 system adenine-specific DNA-methyltransferase PglX [Oscillospiraceae bacterium]